MTIPTPTLQEVARSNLNKIRHGDPGIALVFNDTGLAAHSPIPGNVQVAKDMIKETLIAVGMVPANDGNEEALYTGKNARAIAGQDAVFHLGWVQHQEGLPDVGSFYFVFPKGANNVEFHLSAHVFNT